RPHEGDRLPAGLGEADELDVAVLVGVEEGTGEKEHVLVVVHEQDLAGHLWGFDGTLRTSRPPDRGQRPRSRPATMSAWRFPGWCWRRSRRPGCACSARRGSTRSAC